MKIILHMEIFKDDPNKIPASPLKGIINKEYNSNIIPHAGDIIETIPWESEDDSHFLVQNVFINYDEDYCCVDLANKIVDDYDTVKKLVNEAKAVGWK